MIDILEVIIYEDFLSLITLFFISLCIVLIPVFFGLRFFSGIFMAQFNFFFNVIPIISGSFLNLINYQEGFHFMIIEFSFFLMIVLFYKKILIYRIEIKKSLDTFMYGTGSITIIVFMLFLAIFNFLIVPTDGSSRIGFQVDYWFSFFKPLIYVITPLSTLGVFILISNPFYKKRGFLLFFIIILGNILSGSKAGFIFSFFSAFLILRDLVGNSGYILSKFHKVLIVFLSGIFVITTLFRLDVDTEHIIQRLFLTADATILVYFSDNPIAAGEGVSMFTKMHRGLARLAGDESANNIDTVFGYAVNIIHTGSNTLTGPNARISPYFRAYFQGMENLYGIIVVIIYFVLLFTIFKFSYKFSFFLPFSFPYIVSSISIVSQDFNLLMMDITISTLFLIIIIGYSILPKRKCYV